MPGAREGMRVKACYTTVSASNKSTLQESCTMLYQIRVLYSTTRKLHRKRRVHESASKKYVMQQIKQICDAPAKYVMRRAHESLLKPRMH